MMNAEHGSVIFQNSTKETLMVYRGLRTYAIGGGEGTERVGEYNTLGNLDRYIRVREGVV